MESICRNNTLSHRYFALSQKGTHHQTTKMNTQLKIQKSHSMRTRSQTQSQLLTPAPAPQATSPPPVTAVVLDMYDSPPAIHIPTFGPNVTVNYLDVPLNGLYKFLQDQANKLEADLQAGYDSDATMPLLSNQQSPWETPAHSPQATPDTDKTQEFSLSPIDPRIISFSEL